jgi:sulfatase maturation enzyme AslB (radical SAM superfamily)
MNMNDYLRHMDVMRSLYLDQPHEVSIETLTLCNAACVFCPYPTLERKGTRMDIDTIMGLIDQMSHWTRPFYISPFKVNEPFLDSRLISICSDINERVPVARLRLFSNGTPLISGLLYEIAALRNVEHLWISLNSHDPVDYKRIMNLNFDLTVRNLDRLHALIERDEFTHPVVVSKVYNALGPFVEEPFMYYCASRWPLFQCQLIKQDGWLGYVPPMSSVIPPVPCVRWFELSILATGVVSLCCMDGKGEFSIGNIHAHSLLDIYNSPAWRDRRERLISRHNVHPCSTCTY